VAFKAGAGGTSGGTFFLAANKIIVPDTRKPVEQLHPSTGEVVRTYPGGSDAARFMGISQGGISQCCHGKQVDANGFCWRFYEGPPINWDDPAFQARQKPLEELKEIQAQRLKAPRVQKARAATAAGAAAGAAAEAASLSASMSANEAVDEESRQAAASSAAAAAAAAGAGSSFPPFEPQPKLKMRAPSAYLHFCVSTRQSVLAENPQLSVPEVGSILGKRWKEMGDEDKVPFMKMQEEGQKKLVEQRLKHGVPPSARRERRPVGRPPKAVSQAKKAAKAAGLAAAALIDGRTIEEAMRENTKKPITAFAVFANEVRGTMKAANPEANPQAISKLLRERWEKMDATVTPLFLAPRYHLPLPASPAHPPHLLVPRRRCRFLPRASRGQSGEGILHLEARHRRRGFPHAGGPERLLISLSSLSLSSPSLSSLSPSCRWPRTPRRWQSRCAGRTNRSSCPASRSSSTSGRCCTRNWR